MASSSSREQLLRQYAALERGRGTVRRDHVRDTGAREGACGLRGREVVAGVDVSDVERARRFSKTRAEAGGREELPVIGQAVREVGKDLHVERADDRADAVAGVRPGSFVAGIGRVYG